MKKKHKNILKKIILFITIIMIITFSYLYNNKLLNIKNILTDISFYSENKCNKENNKDINELKKELNIDNLIIDSNKTYASIKYRNNSNWFNTLTINKGYKDNIKKGNAVLSNNIFIGYISYVNKNTSIVKLITSNNDNYVSAKININGNDYYGIIKKYNLIKNELYLENVIGDININNEDVVTSGLTLNMPSGLYIGKAKEIKKDKYNLSNTIIIEPEINYNDIKIVEVISND